MLLKCSQESVCPCTLVLVKYLQEPVCPRCVHRNQCAHVSEVFTGISMFTLEEKNDEKSQESPQPQSLWCEEQEGKVAPGFMCSRGTNVCACALGSEYFMLWTWLYLGQYWYVSEKNHSCPKPHSQETWCCEFGLGIAVGSPMMGMCVWWSVVWTKKSGIEQALRYKNKLNAETALLYHVIFMKICWNNIYEMP